MEDIETTPHIISVEPRDGYRVWVSFSDGVCGEFDAADVVEWTVPESYDTHRSVPNQWHDRAFFEGVWVGHAGWTLKWGVSTGDGQDIWIDEYQAYASVIGRKAEDVKIEWWGEDPEPKQYPQAISVETRDGYRVFLEYDDGVSGELDLSHLADTQVFGFWKESGRFAEVTLDQRANEITWGRDLELCAWHLYEKITGVDLHGFSDRHADISAAD